MTEADVSDWAEECLTTQDSQIELESQNHPFVNSEERIVRTQPTYKKDDAYMTETQIDDYMKEKYLEMITKLKATRRRYGTIFGLPGRPNVQLAQRILKPGGLKAHIATLRISPRNNTKTKNPAPNRNKSL